MVALMIIPTFALNDSSVFWGVMMLAMENWAIDQAANWS
jgi:hypothetical protein